MRSTHRGVRADASSAGRVARSLAEASLAVLGAAAVLLGAAWAIGGDDAISDNWVGMSVAVGLFVGLLASLAALAVAVMAGLRHEPWARLWLPLVVFPSAILTVALLEAFVLE